MIQSRAGSVYDVPAAANAQMRARAQIERVNVLVSYSNSNNGCDFFFRREKKLRARLRFRFEFHSGLGRFRREGGQVWGGSPSEKCPYCGGEIDRGSRGDEVGVEVWYPVGMTAVSFHWVIRFYTCYVFLMKFPCVF